MKIKRKQNKDIIGLLQLLIILQNTMKEEFIIAKHDVQHLKFICASIQEKTKSIPEMQNIEGHALSLEKMIEKFQNKLNEYMNYFVDSNNSTVNNESMEDIVNDFNNIRISYLRSLSVISEELDLLHKTISEYFYSLPPMIDPVRRYKRKIDRDELYVLTNILNSYTERLKQITDWKNEKAKGNPLILLEYSASTKMVDESKHIVKNILPRLDMKEKILKNDDLSGFIKLPYWAIKITEYTSAIAHEIAHLQLNSYSRNKKNSKNLLNKNGEEKITKLKNYIKDSIRNVFYGYNINGEFNNMVDTFSEEIVADILALLIAGPSYYFTLFVQGTARYPKTHLINSQSTLMFARILILANALEKLLENSGLKIDIEQINKLNEIECNIFSKKGSKETKHFESLIKEHCENNKLQEGSIASATNKLINKINQTIVNNLKIRANCKENNNSQEEKECIKKIQEINRNNIVAINRMLYASEKYINSILDHEKKEIYSMEETDEYYALMTKNELEREIIRKVSKRMGEDILSKKTLHFLEKLLEKLHSLKNVPRNSTKHNKEIFKFRKTNKDSIINKIEIKQIKYPENIELEKILLNINEQDISLSNEVLSVVLDNYSPNKRSNDEYKNHYLIPEYLWENTLININKYFSDSLEKLYKDDGELLENFKKLSYKKRLPKLQIARIMGTPERSFIFLEKKDNKDSNLAISSIEEWLFCRVDWPKTKKTYKNTQNSVVKEFIDSIPETLCEKGSETSSEKESDTSCGKANTRKNSVKVNIDFVLGDYDFLISLKGASTRRNIDWPPTKYEKIEEPKEYEKLKTIYSYREYIVEKIEMIDSQNKSSNTKKNSEIEKENNNSDREPYLLQFVRFKESNNYKNDLKYIITGFIKEGFEVYLSNSWNIIFLKIKISEFVRKYNYKDGQRLDKDTLIYALEEVKRQIKNLYDKDREIEIKGIIEDIQTYVVFPDMKNNYNNPENKNSKNNSVNNMKIKIPKMKTIIRTSGILEHKGPNKEYLMQNIVKNINSISNNIAKNTKIDLTLGLTDYIINWNEEISLYTAKDIAIALINKLSEKEFNHITTITSIAVDTINP